MAESANILTKLQDLLVYLIPQLNRFPSDRQSCLSSKKIALIQLSSEWARTDPPAAAFFQTPPVEQLSPFDVGRVAKEWAALDPKAALAWANQLPEGGVHNHAMELAAGAWAQSAPQDAAAFAAGLPAGKLQNRVAD